MLVDVTNVSSNKQYLYVGRQDHELGVWQSRMGLLTASGDCHTVILVGANDERSQDDPKVSAQRRMAQ
jgi:hypothetical protein